ncbi:MAG: hypothetical protein J6S67_00530 [Methanobrevibacter sp.]|nr:hypothetical protein [Methanobrevibacter sp.]
MSNKPKTRIVKIVKSFCTYHPRIVVNGHSRQEFWGVEWTIKEYQNPVLEYYLKKFRKKETAEKFLARLGDVTGSFCPYKEVSVNNYIFTSGKLVSIAKLSPTEFKRSQF